MDLKTAIQAVRAENGRRVLQGYPRNVWGEGFYSDTEFALFWNDREILVVIRGTDSFLNWLMDVAIPFKEETDWGKVGRGVEYGWAQTKEALLKKLRYVASVDSSLEEKPRRTLTFIGHSLGGALAARAAFSVVDERLIDEKDLIIDGVAVWMLGSPRWCDRVFARNYLDRVPETVRYRHRRDPVSFLPFRWMGFRHVGMGKSVGWRGIPLPRYHELRALEEDYGGVFSD